MTSHQQPPRPAPRRAWRRRLGLLSGPVLLSGAVLLAPARAAELVVLVDTGTDMPMAQFGSGWLLGGIHKDVGEALAAKLGRSARFLLLPRKRIEPALASGAADLLCLYIPAWVPGHAGWSRPFFPMAEILLTSRAAARPLALADLAGRPVGTVLGYHYPEMERALGKAFVRADAPSSESNVQKMGAGRIEHLLTSQAVLDYRGKAGGMPALHAPLVVDSFRARCAVSARGRVGIAEVNRAIGRLVADGTLKQIIQRYR